VRPAASVHPEPGSNSSSYIVNMFRQRYSGVIQLNSLKPTLVLCCQFNMSMNFVFFIYSLISQSGCKSTTFILTSKTFLKKFLIYSLSKDCFISLNFWDCKGKNFYHYNPNLF